MVRHPNKHIHAAICYAQLRGWRFEKAGPRAHRYGTPYCPLGGQDGHKATVHSTPRTPELHARRIRRAVDACPHSLPLEDDA